MKTRLLKKLRRRFVFYERNGEYKVFNNGEYIGGIYDQTIWLTKKEAEEVRRKWILEEANNYKVPKRIFY